MLFGVTKGECSDISLKVSHLLYLHAWLFRNIYLSQCVYVCMCEGGGECESVCVYLCVVYTPKVKAETVTVFPWNPQQVKSVSVGG